MNAYEQLAHIVRTEAANLGLTLVNAPYTRVVQPLSMSRAAAQQERIPACRCPICERTFRARAKKSWRPIMLDWEGIKLLKDDLQWTIASEVVRFNQWVFGTPYQSRTDLSMAELCYLRAGGLKMPENVNHDTYAAECLEAGIRQLGLSWTNMSFHERRDPLFYMERFAMPQIFNLSSYWPVDLARAYAKAITVQERVDVAILALDRMDTHGSIMTLEELRTRPPQPVIRLDRDSRRALTYWMT